MASTPATAVNVAGSVALTPEHAGERYGIAGGAHDQAHPGPALLRVRHVDLGRSGDRSADVADHAHDLEDAGIALVRPYAEAEPLAERVLAGEDLGGQRL